MISPVTGTIQGDGVDDGTRTHDDWNHNPGLYQLSYAHHALNLVNLNFRHLFVLTQNFCAIPIWHA